MWNENPSTRTTRSVIRTLLTTACLVTEMAYGDEIYRSKQDGKTVYSNTPSQGAEAVTLPAETIRRDAAPNADQRQETRKKLDEVQERLRSKQAELASAYQQMQEAQAHLAEATEALNKGRDPLPNEWEVTPFSSVPRPKEAYRARLQILESAVSTAQQEYDIAIQRWRDLAN